MKETPMIFHTPNGRIDARYMNAGNHTPLVIIANGHNGFFNYGMFPYIRQQLCACGISSLGFNYSHAGIIGESDVFEDLERYGRNCRRLEKEDLLYVLEEAVKMTGHPRRFILAHSMGGIATVFAAAEAQQANCCPDGIILLCALSTLNVRSDEAMREWKENNGVRLLLNNRTKQLLPQGREYFQETLESVPGGKWDSEPVVRSLKMPVLIAHAADDESVPFHHGELLYEWCGKNNGLNRLVSIPGAGHTLNTRHPFDGPSSQLSDFLTILQEWVHTVNSAVK